MNRVLKTRLSLMMFLAYAVNGTIVPILTLYLKNHLHFAPWQAGVVAAMPAAAAIVAPLAASRIADRYLSAERMLACCHLLCAALMFWLWHVRSFPMMTAGYFLYGVCFTPTFGLTNAVTMHHTPDPRRDFGGIRMWGTAAWVVVAWTFGYFWIRGGAVPGARLPHALPLSALLSLGLAAYAMTLAPTHGNGNGPRTAYREVLRIFTRPSMLLLCALAFFNSACHQFYYFGMSPYLHQMGFADRHIMPAMGLAQASEMIVLGLLGWCLTRITIKQAMAIGVLAQGIRLVMFAVAGPTLLILGGISLHGFCYAFFFTAAYLYAEQHSARETRAGVQQVLTIAISGAGTLAGSLSAGYVAQYFARDASHIAWGYFWTVPAVLAFLITAWLILAFKEEPKDKGAGEIGFRS